MWCRTEDWLGLNRSILCVLCLWGTIFVTHIRMQQNASCLGQGVPIGRSAGSTRLLPLVCPNQRISEHVVTSVSGVWLQIWLQKRCCNAVMEVRFVRLLATSWSERKLAWLAAVFRLCRVDRPQTSRFRGGFDASQSCGSCMTHWLDIFTIFVDILITAAVRQPRPHSGETFP
jgi:hypothetical protein